MGNDFYNQTGYENEGLHFGRNWKVKVHWGTTLCSVVPDLAFF